MAPVPEGCVLGVGNPLLDLLVATDGALCEQYQLKPNDAILAEERHMKIYDEVRKLDVRYAAGGATLNAIKMVQWILGEPRRCTFLGCIGADEPGQILKDDCENHKLKSRFEISKHQSETGKCAVLIQGTQRTMVTHLGAAQDLSIAFIEERESWKLIEQANIYYIAGFVVTSCFDAVLKVAQHARATGKLFCFNFSAPFLVTLFADQINSILPYVDVLFANKSEAEAYAQKHGFGDLTTCGILQQLASVPTAGNPQNSRIVIITQDVSPVLVARADGLPVKEYPVPRVDEEFIVDTTGGGDAFVAGFLAEYAKGGSLDQAISVALKAAKYIIQRPGFILGARETYDELT